LLVTCRKDREYALRQLHHRRQSSAAGDSAGTLPLEGIVAAGIENENRGSHLPVLQPLDDAVGKHGGVTYKFLLALSCRRHIRRQQVVLTCNLEPVAGEKEEGCVAGLNRAVERKQRLAELLPVEIFRYHHIKPELFQRVAHGAGIVDRLLQLRHVLVVVVADHERDAFLRKGRRHEGRSPETNRGEFYQPALLHRKCPCAQVECAFYSRCGRLRGSHAFSLFQAGICVKTLGFFGASRACSIDFRRFHPMFRIDAARYRNAIPSGRR